ncbi:MAG: LPS export ABC transporter permease LptF [Alphaproteobacteria bacterium]
MIVRSTTLYVLRQLLVYVVLITSALTFAVWLTQSLRFVDLIVNRGLTIGAFLYFVLLLLPSLLAAVLPVALFVAALFVYNRMLADNELVVLRAVGFSNLALSRPVLIFAGVLAVALLLINAYLVSASYRAFKDMQYTLRNEVAAILQEGMFNSVDDGITVYVRARDTEGELYGIFLHDGRDPARRVTAMAERGALVMTEEGARVLMVNGTRQELDPQTGQLSTLVFDQYTMDLGVIGEAVEDRFREPTERDLPDLFADPRNESEAFYLNEFRAEGHARISAAIYALTFPMIGLAFLFAGEFSRRSRMWRLVAAGVAVIVIKAGEIGWQSLARSDPMAVPMLYANALIPLLIALYVVMRTRTRRRRAASMAVETA